MALRLPIYALVYGKAVKAVRTEEGGMDVLVYNPATDQFQRDMGIAHHLLMPSGEEDLLTEAEFESLLEQQRQGNG